MAKKKKIDPRAEAEEKLAREAFDKVAAGAETIPFGGLATVLDAIGKPQELERAAEVIEFMKKWGLAPSPEGQLAWQEIRSYLYSDSRKESGFGA